MYFEESFIGLTISALLILIPMLILTILEKRNK